MIKNLKTDIDLYDNKILIILIFFLPFSQALTFNVGFPLKISELCVFLELLLIIYYNKVYLRLTYLSNPLILLFGWAIISLLINLLWEYDYPLNLEYLSRAGYIVDSILKLFYFLLAIIIYLLASKIFSINQIKYIKYFLYGGVIAGLYSWYLFIMSILGFQPFLLIGMEENPQKIYLFIGEIIRCGTFKEGNYMALFLFVSTVIALYNKRKKLAIFFSISIITTVSTVGTLTLIFFWFMYFLKKSKTKNEILKLIFVLFLSLSSLTALLQNDDFNMIFVSKLNLTDSEIVDPGAYSKEDRKNTILNALRMGLDNPVFGIGLSNYALHYKYYNETYETGFENYDKKVIANNVYAEIFSELGAVGLFLFGLFLYLLYLKSKEDESGILTLGLFGCLFYFMAFPTFTILFIWVFFGLINSLQKDNYETSC